MPLDRPRNAKPPEPRRIEPAPPQPETPEASAEFLAALDRRDAALLEALTRRDAALTEALTQRAWQAGMEVEFTVVRDPPKTGLVQGYRMKILGGKR